MLRRFIDSLSHISITEMAAEYTKETGVPVTVVTAASGQYETTLMSEMEKSEAPTLFHDH